MEWNIELEAPLFIEPEAPPDTEPDTPLFRLPDDEPVVEEFPLLPQQPENSAASSASGALIRLPKTE